MYRSGQVRSGQVRSGQVRSGQVRSGQVRSGQVRSGQVRSGQVRPGQVRSGQVRSGQVRSGKGMWFRLNILNGTINNKCVDMLNVHVFVTPAMHRAAFGRGAKRNTTRTGIFFTLGISMNLFF